MFTVWLYNSSFPSTLPYNKTYNPPISIITHHLSLSPTHVHLLMTTITTIHRSISSLSIRFIKPHYLTSSLHPHPPNIHAYRHIPPTPSPTSLTTNWIITMTHRARTPNAPTACAAAGIDTLGPSRERIQATSDCDLDLSRRAVRSSSSSSSYSRRRWTR